MSEPIPKESRVDSDTWLDIVRHMPCIACLTDAIGKGHHPIETARRLAARGSEAHHFPPKGMGGARHRDDMTMPLCRSHHYEAQTYKIPQNVQMEWVMSTRSTVLEICTPEQLDLIVADLKRYKTRSLIIPA